MLCKCTGHSREEIENMLSAGRYGSFSEFRDDTFVGAGCGQCLQEVEELFGGTGNAKLFTSRLSQRNI